MNIKNYTSTVTHQVHNPHQNRKGLHAPGVKFFVIKTNKMVGVPRHHTRPTLRVGLSANILATMPGTGLQLWATAPIPHTEEQN